MGHVVDLGSVETRDFDALPAGTYHVAISGYEWKEAGPNAKHPGSEYINFEFTVQSGEYEDRKLWANASLLPHALFTLKGIAAAIGADASSGAFDVDAMLEDIEGKELYAVVKVKVYEGDKRNEIKGFKSMGEGAATAGKSSGGSLLP